MPRLTLQDQTTYYQDIGNHRKTLVLLHGWGHYWEGWADYVPTLSQTHRLIIPDIPGFGLSQSEGDGWDMKRYAEWLRDLLHALDIKELDGVVGYSFGGKIAVHSWYTPWFPSLPAVKQIFLISPSGIVPPASPQQRIMGSVLGYLPKWLKRSSLLRSLRLWLYTTLLQESDYLKSSPFQEGTLHKILPADIRSVAKKSPKNPPLRIIWGEKDLAVPVWMAYQFATLHADTQVAIVPDGDHFIINTHRSTLERWFKAWL